MMKWHCGNHKCACAILKRKTQSTLNNYFVTRFLTLTGVLARTRITSILNLNHTPVAARGHGAKSGPAPQANLVFETEFSVECLFRVRAEVGTCPPTPVPSQCGGEQVFGWGVRVGVSGGD